MVPGFKGNKFSRSTGWREALRPEERESRKKLALIKVAIADANTLLREGLKKIFSAESDLLVVGHAGDDAQVADVVQRTSPDVLLLDLHIGKGGAVPVLLELNQKNTAPKVLILSLVSDEENILDAAKAGAQGYILKRESSKTLIEAIRRIFRGEIWVDRQLGCAEAFLEFARRTSPHDAKGDENQITKITKLLSRRENEVLPLVAKGFTNREIGKTLFIDHRTVKAHLNHIFNKLDVRNRTQAALRFAEADTHESPGWKTTNVEQPPNPPTGRPRVLSISRPRRRANRLLRSGRFKHDAPSHTEKPEPHE